MTIDIIAKEQSDFSDMPLVSLVITSFDRAKLIEKAIQSALMQDYPNLEIIISDNCSTDNSDEVIRQYLSDPRVKYSRNTKNIGMIPNFKKATVQLATGKYITYISSDDYLVNDSFVSEAVTLIQRFPTIQLVHGINATEIIASNEFFLDASYMHYKDSYYKKPYVRGWDVFFDYPSCHSISFGGTLFERDKVVGLRPFDGKVYSFDVLITLQLLQLGDAAFIDKETYVVRRHGGNMTSTVSKAQTYIDNLAYIEEPYRFAVERNQVDKDFLAQWREDMYCNFCAQCLLNLYKTNRSEYEALASYLKINQPVIFRKITKNIYWYLKKALFANKSISSAYLWLTQCYRKIKPMLHAG